MARLLVIEDAEILRTLVQRMLQQAGHKVLLAADSRSALAAWRSEQIDLVIADIGLPGKSGLETVIEMRALQPSLPIIVISGRGREELLDLITGAGLMDGVQIVRKPFEVEELLAAVQEAVVSASAKSERSPE